VYKKRDMSKEPKIVVPALDIKVETVEESSKNIEGCIFMAFETVQGR